VTIWKDKNTQVLRRLLGEHSIPKELHSRRIKTAFLFLFFLKIFWIAKLLALGVGLENSPLNGMQRSTGGAIIKA